MIEVKKAMQVEPKTPAQIYRERSLAITDRLCWLVDLLEEVRRTIDDIPEENNLDSLKSAYKELGKAFAKCIDAEQAKLSECVEEVKK